MENIYFIFLSYFFIGCGNEKILEKGENEEINSDSYCVEVEELPEELEVKENLEETTVGEDINSEENEKIHEPIVITFLDFNDIPPYSDNVYIPVHENIPYFLEIELQGAIKSFETYASLDELGRCGVCKASIGTDIMPTEERGEIGDVKPTGWKQNKYPGLVEENYLYNRCHLIGYQLTGEMQIKKI